MSSEALGQVLHELHSRWMPHDGQIPVGEALFYEGCNNIFVSCGRNWGKTDFAEYSLNRWAALNPNSENYYFAPYMKQAREILWASNRIQNMVPKHWVQSINNTEMRIILKNGSFIKLDGSDNVDALRGIKPKGLIVYDEIKDHKRQFLDAFEPNRAAFNVPALFLGTPPEFHNHFVELMELSKTSKHWKFFQAPTAQNPFLSKTWLDNKRAEYEANNDLETWQREYEGIYVLGGKRHIIPQSLAYKPKARAELWPKDINNWEVIVCFDPAASSVFGVLFALHNKYLRKLIVFDELYLSDQKDMVTREVWNKVEAKLKHYRENMGLNTNSDNIHFVYDEAASWFRNESNEISQHWLNPTHKAKSDKETGLSAIRDMFNQSLVEIALECEHYLWELHGYVKDENGNVPKVNDHLIDCFRYVLMFLGYDTTIREIPKPKDKDLEKRYESIDDVFKPNLYADLDGSDWSALNYD